MSRIKSILKDSDSQCSRLVRSNFLPSGSISLTSNISSKSTPAMSDSVSSLSCLDRLDDQRDQPKSVRLRVRRSPTSPC